VLKGLQLTESEIDKAIKALTPIKRNIKSLSSVLSNISDIEGSKLEQLINNLYKKSTGRDLPRINKEIGPMLSNDTALFNTIRKNYEMLSNMLCEEAGKIIYKKLVYASIDLSKSGAKAGEVLHIYVTWKITKLTGSAVPPRLTIGKYYIRETGWKVEVSDIFSLVERIGENKDNSGTVSPSNFKGAGGAVLMLTYFGEDRGLKITNRGDTYKIHKKNRLLNALQPSIGINISYLDFSTKKDVEIGTALQVGLFRNKIFFGYGLNLHMIRSQDISPRYIFLGLSFAKLEDLFKNTSAGTK
jgi:hypothetical protein